MTDKDNSQTGEYSYTYSYSYSKEGGEKNVEVHTGGFSAATAGEAAVDSTGKTTAGESSSGKSATGKTTTIKMITGVLNPDEGSISINGKDIVKNQKHHRQDYHTFPQHDHQLPKQHQLPQ
mgnify:CR=1 FL=1